jgi:hypothetical protein
LVSTYPGLDAISKEEGSKEEVCAKGREYVYMVGMNDFTGVVLFDAYKFAVGESRAL